MRNLEIKNENGRSMIEMLGVLAIIGVLSVGGIAGYSKAMMKYRINKTIEQITLIAGNVRTFFAPQRNYDGLDNSNNKWIIQKAKLVPEEMYGSEGSSSIDLINAFGEDVYLKYENKAQSGDNQAFYIKYHLDKNEEACIELLSNDWTNAGVKAYRVAGGPAYDNKLFKAPLDVATAVDTCSKAKEQGYWIEINFYFDIDLNSNYWSSKTWEN
ncbi:MAG: hypothetical protein IJ525_03600 [Alphaproteobacteria bacterium]|nr:hypothetical protein [Alphaproteobacteria bacterium]